MKIGVPKEIKPQEGRVGLMPAEVSGLVAAGNTVYVETNAGLLSGAADANYAAAGATIVGSPVEAYDADLIVKVKEFLTPEYGLLEARHTVFTNLDTSKNLPDLAIL